MKKRVLFAVVVALAFVCVLAGCAQQADVAAKFSNHTIFEDEVSRYTEQFRADNGYEDDEDWAEYFSDNGLTTQTWREQAIAALADRLIMRDKAAELGITASDEEIEEQLASIRSSAGIDEGDSEKWQAYLDRHKVTDEEVRERCELTVLETKVFEQEVTPQLQNDDASAEAYVEENLLSVQARKYFVISFDTDQKTEAKAALNELKSLSGDALATRYDEIAATYTSGSGWDLQMDFSTAKNVDELNDALLQPGELFGKLLKSDDGYALMLCTDVFTFKSGFAMSDISDDDLASYIRSCATAANYSSACTQYLEEQREAANIQVAQMPSGLPYAVD